MHGFQGRTEPISSYLYTHLTTDNKSENPILLNILQCLNNPDPTAFFDDFNILSKVALPLTTLLSAKVFLYFQTYLPRTFKASSAPILLFNLLVVILYLSFYFHNVFSERQNVGLSNMLMKTPFCYGFKFTNIMPDRGGRRSNLNKSY